MSELHAAVRALDAAAVARLLALPCAVDEADDKRRTALHLAAWKGSASTLRMLLEAGADCRPTAMDGFTALHFAAQSGCADCCVVLAAAAPSLLELHTSKGGRTALHLAVDRPHLAAVRALIQAGADPSATTKAGLDARAIARSKREAQELLSILEEPATDKVPVQAPVSESAPASSDTAPSRKRKIDHAAFLQRLDEDI